MKKNSIALNKILVLILLLNMWLCKATAQQVLVWSDEFNASALNTNYWMYDTATGCATGNCGWGNNELEFYTNRSQNVRLENGSLVLQADRETMGGKPFTSGRIKTAARVSFKYGTLEARIKVPEVGNGLWPAFWLLGTGGGAWPHNGETDILEMGFAGAIADGTVNKRVNSTLHWWTTNPGGYTGHASYGKDTVNASGNLSDDYHLYKMVWDKNYITTYLDGQQFYKIGISGGNGFEAFQQPSYILLNLAVGGNYPGITTVAGITAPLPGKMLVDYIRLYQDVSQGDQLLLGTDDMPEGKYGIFTETTSVDDAVVYGQDANLFIWNNMSNIPSPVPAEGNQVWALRATTSAWYGMGVSNTAKNMRNFANGNLNFKMKTSSNAVFKVGIATTAGEGWVNFTGTNEYGLIRDGQWHDVSIPVSAFTGIDLISVTQLFMLSGNAPAATFDIYIDDIYYSGGVAANPAPKLSIIDPINDSLITTPTNINIQTNARDTNGVVSQVVFYANSTTYLGTATTAPFNFNWANAPEGVYTLTAKATDDGGVSTTSKPIRIFVAAPGNLPPVISITSPTATTNFTKPATVNIATNVTDDGQVYKVEFYNGNTLLGVDDTAPYTFSWAGVDMGSYAITAKAYDNGKLSTVSDTVYITVKDNIVIADKFGIYSEDTSIHQKLTYGLDANLYTWNNMTAVTGSTPYEGTQVMAFSAAAGAWFGLGVANDVRNLSHFNDGSIKFHFKTTYTGPFKFGMVSGLGDAAISFAANEQKFGLIRDGAWHEVMIPLASFTNLDLATVTQAFTFSSGTAPAAATAFYMDNVYYTIESLPNILPTISITSPGNNGNLFLPNPIVFATRALDPDGAVAKVIFYSGTDSIGASTVSPYAFSWANPPLGTFAITAKVIDNRGGSGISSPIIINVKDAVSKGPNLALLRPATASSQENTTNKPANAVDGNFTGTRWASLYSDTQWICVKLSALYNIDEVKITWQNSRAVDYKIQYSVDSVAWIDAQTIVGNAALVNDYPGMTPMAARFVRMAATKRYTTFGYSIFELEVYGSLPTILPLSMVSFTATKKPTGGVELAWITTNEINTSHFEIERSSNGSDWTMVGRVVATKGILSNNYTFNDAHISKGTFYYRLKQVDTDGKFVYSQVRTVRLSADWQVDIFPNPVIGNSLTVTSNDYIKSISVLNTFGQSILNLKPAAGITEPLYKVNIANLVSGVYYFKCISKSDEVKFFKVIKQ